MPDETAPYQDLTLEEAVAHLEAAGRARASQDDEPVSLDEAPGRVLARDVAARADHPSVDASALDGYACRGADAAEARPDGPVRLRLRGRAEPGRPFAGPLAAGEAVRVQTGAAVPAGADAVAPVEVAHEADGWVTLTGPARPEAVRPRGSDVARGSAALRAGMRLDVRGVALAASMGHARLPVRPRPRVVILTTGQELVEAGTEPRPAATFDAIGPALRALVRAAGAAPVATHRVGDDVDALRYAMEANGPVDLYLTSGGLSMGWREPVRDLLRAEGTVAFRRVRVKPGGPTTFGAWRGTPLLALPGNPVSALVLFHLLGRAFLDRRLGDAGPLPFARRVPARAAAPLRAARGKATLLRVCYRPEADGLQVLPAGEGPASQESSAVRALAEADALALLPPDAALEVGDPLWTLPLRGPWG